METTERYLAIKKNNFGLGLKSIDLLILSQIDEFQSKDMKCFMTNEQFSNLFGESMSTIKRSLDKLEELNIVSRINSFVQGNGKSTKQRVLILNDRKKWKVQNEPTKIDDEEIWKVQNEPTNDKWKVQNEPTKMNETENGRFIMNLPNEMEGSKSDFGRFKNDKWKVHNEPIRTNLRENLRTNLDGRTNQDGNFVSTGRHPSGSSEHSSSAECPTDTAPPKAGLEPAKKKDKNRRRMPNELAIQEKKEIVEGYREGTMEYPDMYDRYNVKKGTLNYEKILEFESEIAEYDKNKEKKVIISQLESQPDKLAKLSEYSGCSIEEVKENVSKFKLNPDMLIDCFEGDSGYIYEHDYWLEKYKNQHTYWDWVSKCYDLQYHASLGSGSVVGSSSYSAKTENFDDIIDDVIDDVNDSGLSQDDLDWLASL